MASMTFYVVEQYDPAAEVGKRTDILTDPDDYLTTKDKVLELRRAEKARGGKRKYTAIKTSY